MSTTDEPGSRRNLLSILNEEFEQLHGIEKKYSSLTDLYEAILGLRESPRAALCLSGGGIRSACFALGVLQALARHQLLSHFHYLSTVSGGGYIGSWLSAWRRHKRNDTGKGGVFEALAVRQVDPPDEPAEIRGLRASSNFLTPKLGIMSADTWTGVALYVRNLFLNWLIYGPLLLSVVLLPMAAAQFVEWGKTWSGEANYSVVAAAALLYFIGLAVSAANRPGAGRSRIGQTGYLLYVLSPIYLGSVLFVLHAVLANPGSHLGAHLLEGVVYGAVLYGLAFLVAYGIGGRSVGLTWRSTEADPVPSLGRFLSWIVAGAAAGAMVYFGFDMWARAANGFNLGQMRVDPARAVDLLIVLGIGWTMLSVLTAELVYVGFASYARDGDMEREWLARSSGWLVAVTLAWVILAAIVLFGPVGLRWLGKALSAAIAGAGGVSGAIAALMGRSTASAATPAGKGTEKFSTTLIISVATLVFLICLTIVLSGVVDRLEGAFEADSSPGLRLAITVALLVGALVLSVVVSYFVNVNRFSLHAVYRNRLIRAFLGAARASATGPAQRRPDPFTGFDTHDNIQMRDLWNPAPNGEGRRLFHVVNMALNVVASENLAWQERKAETFTVTPLACGNPYVGFRATARYGAKDGGITLGTAVAISGAAASPNQGYHSSPLVGILMMLFNVRLGWWLGNPKNDKISRQEGPTLGILPVIRELFGLTTDQGNYIYLSDGGHFENLGLYEMARRRCRYIVVSDAGCDPDCALEDLGNAIRKIWIDLGIRIIFERIGVKARNGGDKPVDAVYCALGSICYPEGGEPGCLVYVKPGYYGCEPADIRSYAAAHATFPHESTADQWFSESQMESYRALGAYIIDTLCSGSRASRGAGAADPCKRADEALDLGQFIEQVRRYLGQSDTLAGGSAAGPGTGPAP